MSNLIPNPAVGDAEPLPWVSYLKSQPVIVAHCLALALQLPILSVYFSSLWDRSHYHFFPFALIFVGGTIYQATERNQQRLISFPSRLGDILIGLSIPFALFHTLTFDIDFASISIYLVSASLLLRLGFVDSGPAFRHLVLPLAIIVRPPFNLDTTLIAKLQRTTSDLTGFVLDALGVIHFRLGNVIRLPTRTEPLMVEEACSGVQGLYTLAFVALALTAYHRRSLLHIVLVVASSIVWALYSNMLRVSAICMFDYFLGIDLVPEPQHSALGYACLSIAIVMLVSTDQLLELMISTRSFNGGHTQLKRASCQTYSFFAALLLALMAIPPVVIAGPLNLLREASGFSDVVSIPVSHLPGTFSAGKGTPTQWTVEEISREERDRSSIWGSYSTSWQLNQLNQDRSCHFSCDYPFTDWHELSVCYRGNGWKIDSGQWGRRIHVPSDSNWPVVSVDLRQPTGAQAFLIFSFFDAYGRPVRPPVIDALTAGFLGRLKLLFNSRWNKPYGPKSTTYQVQAFFQLSEPISKAEKEKLISAYADMRGMVASEFRNEIGK
jgi:exosortase